MKALIVHRLTSFRALTIAWLAVTWLAPVRTFGETGSGSLGAGSDWETPWKIIDSGAPGPTVLLVGGIHGNEPAGFRAAEQIQHWPISRGKLVVLPQVNRLGLKANMRWIPAHRNDRATRDGNRNFPGEASPDPRTPLCRAVWEFVVSQKPDWVFDLHEGFDFHRQNPKSVGSSIITFPAQAEFAASLQRSVNADLEPQRRFSLLAKSGPAEGSLARACGERLGAKAFILETTFKSQEASLRTRQHRRMMSTALQRCGLIMQDCTNRLAPPKSSGLTRVGIFDGAGANESPIIKLLDEDPAVFAVHLGPGDFTPSILGQFDVLVFPGGSGNKQGRALGEEGRRTIRSFVHDGGGVVGICAGAYLCSSHYSWSLHLMNAAVFNKTIEVEGKGKVSMWYRGPATDVLVECNPAGQELLGVEGVHSIRYQNGPILSPGNRPALPAFRPLAYFRSENGIYAAQRGTMKDKPAVVLAEYGRGKVLAISPHFETTRGMRSVVLRALKAVKRRSENP